MKTNITLQQMAIELERQAKVKHDYIAPTKELKFECEFPPQIHDEAEKPDYKLRINGHANVGINEIAHRQIGGRVGIPQKYYDRMRSEAPHLLADNVNHWFQNKPEKRMVRTLDGNARAFLSSRYRPLDNLPIAEVAIETLQGLGGLKIESSALTDSRMYIKAVTETMTYEIKKGDVVQAGLVISNSEVGMGSVKVEPMIYRLICLNGMIANDHAMRKYHIGRGFEAEMAEELYEDDTRRQDDKAFMLKVRDVIRNSFNKDVFERLAKRMIETTENKITGDPIKVVEITQKRFGLADIERVGVLKHLIEGKDLSQWGLLNAVTRTSQDVQDYDRATELERMGGTILELPQRSWKEFAEAV